mgnify:CR=1 FL=1
MKIEKKDLKHDLMVVIPESLDDLWTLEKVLKEGDIVSGKTQRSIEIRRGEKSVKTGRKTVFLKIEAEDVHFDENGKQVRVKGQIIEGPEEVSRGYHTMELKVNKKIGIVKEWRKYQIKKLEKAKVKQPTVLISVMDDESATFALLNKRIKYLTTIKGTTGKQYETKGKEDYYKEIASFIEKRRVKYVIIAGPGFVKESVKKMLQDSDKKILMDSTSHTGKNGIQEVLKRGMVERIIKKSELAEETQLVEKFFEKLSKEEKVVYGKDQVKEAIDMGAVDTLLISDTLVRENENLLEKAESMNGEVHIIGSEHEAGDRFKKMGGIACFLRYQINF